MRKRLISGLIVVSMLAGLLVGCTTALPSDKETKGTGGTDRETAADAAVPKGRYTESDLELPVGGGERIVDMIQLDNGDLELYSMKDGVAYRYVYSGGSWEKQEKSLLEGLNLEYQIFHMVLGGDGERYVIYPVPDDYMFRFVRLSENGDQVALVEDRFAEKRESGIHKLMPDFGGITPSGEILVSTMREAYLFNEQGEEIMKVSQTSAASEWKKSGLLDGDDYVTNGEKSFLRYDLSSRSSSPYEEIPYQDEKGDFDAALVPDGAGGLYLANPNGIHHIGKGGSLWETIADGSLNSLSLPSAYVCKLFLGGSDDFYVWMKNGDKDILKHYSYDSEMPSVPSNTLTVYGLNLENSAAVKQAASVFQLENPDVRVELIDGGTESGGAQKADTIRALNTELLSGNGADVLILDGLPVDSYIEKGVLQDMREILAPMISSGELMENVTVPYTEKDGSIYTLPSRVVLLAALGSEEAVGSLNSMAELKRYQESHKDIPVRPKTKYSNLMKQMMALYYEEIVDHENKKLVPGKVKELLETVKAVGEAAGAQSVFDESEDGGMGRIYNRDWDLCGFSGNEFDYISRKVCSTAIETVQSFGDTMLPFAVAEKLQMKQQTVNRTYLPVEAVGINSGSRQKELAEQFVLCLLGAEIQGNDLMDGLPVNTAAAQEWVATDREGYSIVMSSGDGPMMSGVWPDEAQRKEIFDLLAQAERPVRTDSRLLEIIVDETSGYFDGSLSLEQAVENAQNKANLYFSE